MECRPSGTSCGDRLDCGAAPPDWAPAKAGASGLLRLLRDRHRDAGDFEVDRAQVHAAGEEQRLPVVTAEAEVRGGGLSVDDTAEFLARGIEDVEPARTAAKDIAGNVNFHPVRHAWFGALQ